ncbi:MULTISPECIES: hypothetical protein [unclassified Streptomyces]|nr:MULTISPECIES: hypothetical protein [unclassified Streptomyces]SCG05100.1 hypothetical protein GA0115259_109311 [Streptomyces sp. MnatMP-M17]
MPTSALPTSNGAMTISAMTHPASRVLPLPGNRAAVAQDPLGEG